MPLTSGMVFFFFAFILPAVDVASTSSGSVRAHEIVNGRQINTATSATVGQGVESTTQRPAPNKDQGNDGPIGGELESFQSDSDQFNRPITKAELSLDSDGRRMKLHSDNEQLPRPSHKRPDAKEYDDEDNEEEEEEDEKVVADNVSLTASTDYGEEDDGNFNVVHERVNQKPAKKKVTSTKRAPKRSSTKTRASATSSASVGANRQSAVVDKRKKNATLKAVRDKNRPTLATSASGMRTNGRRLKTSATVENELPLNANRYPIIAPGLGSEDLDFKASGSYRQAYNSDYRLVEVPDDRGNEVASSPSFVEIEVPLDYQHQLPEVQQSAVPLQSPDHAYIYEDPNADAMVEIKVDPPGTEPNGETGNWMFSDGDEAQYSEYSYSQPNYFSSGDQTIPTPMSVIYPDQSEQNSIPTPMSVVYPDQSEQNSIRLSTHQKSSNEGIPGLQMSSSSYNTGWIQTEDYHGNDDGRMYTIGPPHRRTLLMMRRPGRDDDQRMVTGRYYHGDNVAHDTLGEDMNHFHHQRRNRYLLLNEWRAAE